MTRSVIILIATLVLGCVFKANGNDEELLISNESFLNLGDGEIDQHLVDRAVTSASLSDSGIASFLDKHNELRGQTVPTASNMQYMVWDSNLATMAQQWTDRCEYAHGNPPNISPFSFIGQNIFMVAPGSRSTPVNGSIVVQTWFNEGQYYTYESNTCKPSCGHFTQVVWARSYAVGCGASFCPITTGNVIWKNAWFVSCNYGPGGNGAGKPYLQGSPCTQCDSGIGQCYNNQCRLCSTHSEKCECKQVCLNGAVFDQANCSCKCADGFRGTDCSQVCEDTHSNCGANPGWPKSWCTKEFSFVLTNCPAMCGLCTRAPCLRTCNANGGTLDTEKCICKCNEGFQGEDCGTCVKQCQNGGKLNPQDCVCKCPAGFGGVQCEKVCEDTHSNCGANPGWPKSWCTKEFPFVLTNCPAMCGLCTRAPCLRTCNANSGTLDTEKCICKCNERFQGQDCGTCKDCKNGGELNQPDCKCKCKRGFTGVECEKVCEDTHVNCGTGWPKSWCVADRSYVLFYCPLFCGICEPAAASGMQLTDENIMDELQ